VTKSFLSPALIARVVSISELDLRRSRTWQRIDCQSIPWTQFVLAVWELDDDQAMTGDLPVGVSNSQFWAKVTRAAKDMGGTVGIRTRRNRFWVWPWERGAMKPRGGSSVRTELGRIMLVLAREERVALTEPLGEKMRRWLLADARRRGWKVHISKDGKTVQIVGEK
jgi:hypothetical protein